MLSRVERYPFHLSNCGSDLKAGQLHIVCPALAGMTNLNVFACLFGKITLEEVHLFADRVNSTRKCETLYPRVALTLFPLHRSWKQSQEGQNRNFGEIDEIDRNLRECLQIQRKRIKTPNLLFALDQGNVFDRHLVLSRLKLMLLAEPSSPFQRVYYDLQA